MITYGSEIWGTSVHDDVENVLVQYCRMQLGVNTNAPGPAVLGECGSHGVYVYCYVKCVKYWLKLTSLPDGNITKSCYTMLLKHCKLGRKNWASEIKHLLYRYGFGYVWENQGNIYHDQFLEEFKMRVVDCHRQNWSENMSNMSKLRTFSLFKSSLSVETYLLLDIPHRFRKALSKFRIGIHDLEIEIGRRSNVPPKDRLCKLCLSINEQHVEDEYHVICSCSFYADLRRTYLFEHAHANLFDFVTLMKEDNKDCVTSLAMYIISMFKVRSALLKSL